MSYLLCYKLILEELYNYIHRSNYILYCCCVSMLVVVFQPDTVPQTQVIYTQSIM